VISITIRGVDFLANLIVLDSKGIDIILGTDWLRKYDRVLLCAKRAIRLTKKDGTIVEFNAAIQAKQVSLLNKVQGTSLNEIGIAQEYPDVFPEDLSSTPLDHDIEFIIELLPRMPPDIPHSEIARTKPPYVCPGCFIHTYSNNMINRFHVQ
jgi:hypothetical protein